MGPPNVLVSSASASLLLPGSLCYLQPQVGSLIAASDLFQLHERQEHPDRLITALSGYIFPGKTFVSR